MYKDEGAKRFTELERAEKIEAVLADSFKDHEKVKGLSSKEFAKLTSDLQKIANILKESSSNTSLGISEVKAKLFNKEKNNDKTRQFLSIMSKIWNKEVLQPNDIDFLTEVNMTPLQANKIAMMGHPEWDDRNTVAVATTKVMQTNFVLDDESIKKIATYLAGIGEHYALKHGSLDKRDLEWAIELGKDGSIDMKGIGIQGIKRKGKGVFSPLQARPVTSKIVDGSPFAQIKSTEVDKNYLKANNIEPISKGVKGVGAAVGDYLYFVDDQRPLGEQENEIRELVAAKKRVVAVIEFGGPQHDPIMKAANGGVITSQGGGTSHVAIFCREQGIVAVTGLGSDHTGKSRVEILKELQVSEGDNFKITIDANNGLIYGAEVKINEIFTEIKVPYLPELQNTKVGLILGSPTKAQKLSKLADYVSSYGISLARGEFIAEQMGLHPKVARCYGIMQILEKSAYYESKRDELEKFQKNELKDFDIFLAENTYLADKFESLRIEGIKPEKLPRNFGPHMDMYEKYLKKIDLNEMLFFQEINNRIQLSDEDIDDLAKYVKWLTEYPEEYQQMLELTRGYEDPESYVSMAMSGPQSAIALSLGLTQVCQNRAFDNKPNEDASKGAKVFTPKIWEGENLTTSQKENPFNNPLISLRGISLLNRQKEYDMLLEGLFISVKSGVKNQGLMNVFIRTPREIRLFLEKMEKMAEKYGVMPSEVGLMTEVPSNYFYAPEMSMLLNAFYARNAKKYGLKKVYFSFGTNDLTNLSGGTDRDDPRLQNFVIKDTWVIDSTEKELSRLPKEAKELIEKNKKEKGMQTIPLADESSTVLKRIMQAIIAEAKNPANATFQLVLETAKLLNKHPLNVTIEDVKKAGFYGIFVGLCGQAIIKGIEGGTIAETQELIFLLDSFGTDDKNFTEAAMTAFDAEQRFAELINKEELSEIENTNLFNLPDQGTLTGLIVRISKKEDINSTKLDHLKPDEQKLALLKNPMHGTKVATKIVIVDGPLGNERDFSAIVDEKTGETIQKATSWEDLRYSKAIFIDQTYWIENGKLNEKKMKEDLSILYDNDKLKHRIKGIGSFTKDKFLDEQIVAFSYKDKKVYRGENAQVKYLTPEHKTIVIPEISINEIDSIEGVSFSTAEVFAKNKVHPLKIWADNKETAEADFMREFINAFKEKIQDKNQEVLWKAETLDRGQLKDKEFGVEFEGKLNENTRLGIRDATRLLTDFEGINHAQLKAIKKLLDEGYKINYQITNLKGTRSKEVLAASLLATERLGLKEYKNFKVGVNISTLSDIIQVEEYLDWVDYIHVDFKELAFSLLALDPVAQEMVEFGVIKDDEVLAVMTRPLKVILKAIQNKNKFLFIDSLNELEDLAEIQRLDKYQKDQKRAAKVFQEIGLSLMEGNKNEIANKFLDMSFKFNTLTYRPIYDKEDLTSLRYYLVNEKHDFNIKEYADVLKFLSQEMNREVPKDEVEQIQRQVTKTYELKSISKFIIKNLDNIKRVKEAEISA